MPPSHIWQNLDRLSFCENAILLDLKSRSQGKPIKMRASEIHYDIAPDSDLPSQMIRDFLDDFALVVSGNGGKDNVSAASMEISDQGGTILLRVARNEGLSEQMMIDLRRILQVMTQNIPAAASEIDPRRESILLEILRRCRGRLFKHVERFLNELRNEHCRPGSQYRTPAYVSETGATEAIQDIERLGIHNSKNHSLYMQVCRDRLNQLRNLSTELICASNSLNFQKMIVLTKVAYDVRRSSSFRQFLIQNLEKTKRPKALVLIVSGIVERLGKISRFYRAAMIIAAFGMELLKKNMTIDIQSVPALKVEIPELNGRTTAQLRVRGGYRFNSCSGCQLQGMIKRWPTYRLHSEIQLIVFYEENPNLQLYSSYIGCDKLSCYLCYSFIKHHSHFRVNGCHQGLYSLWAVPDLVSFENEERANHFRKGLKKLCDDLERKMAILREPKMSYPKYTSNNESIANLSRISLPLTFTTVEQGSTEQSAYGESVPSRQTRSVAVTSPATSQSNLATIPEICPVEQVEVTKETEKTKETEETGKTEETEETGKTGETEETKETEVTEVTEEQNNVPPAISDDIPSPVLQSASATQLISAERLEAPLPAVDAHTETVTVGSVPVGIASAFPDVTSKTPSIRCEGSRSETPQPKQHLQSRQPRHHRHHKYNTDRPRTGEDSSSSPHRTSRRRPVDVLTRKGPRHRQRRNHLSQGQRRRRSSNDHRSRRDYRRESVGSSQPKNPDAGFLQRLWDFCSLVMGGCVGKPRRRG